jgi:quercetin dioxygenase-like cupin family protein
MKKTINEKQIEKEWVSRGFSFGVWIDPPGQMWNDFVHDVDELLMLVEGELELTIDGKRFYPQIGEEILIPAHANHSVKNIGNKTSRWLYGYRQ